MTRSFHASRGSEVSSWASVMPSDLGLLGLRPRLALFASRGKACLGPSRASATLVSARHFEARAGSMLAACFVELQRNTIRILSDGGPPTQTR